MFDLRIKYISEQMVYTGSLTTLSGPSNEAIHCLQLYIIIQLLIVLICGNCQQFSRWAYPSDRSASYYIARHIYNLWQPSWNT